MRQDGQTGFRQDLADQPGTDIVAYETVTGHNVPRVFNDFRNAGPVPAIAAFGYPITDPYWIKAKVGGQDKDIMVQVFERRTITYTPSNPAAFRVEMGNVGQHYFMWRYSVLGQPWSTPDPQWPIAFASKTDNNAFDMYLMETPGSSPQRVLTSNALPYSMRHSWMTGENKNPLIYGELTNASGKRQIFTMSPGSRQPNVLSNNTSNDYNPAVSPDSKQVAFASDRDGNAELYLLIEGQEQGVAQAIRLTETTGCSNEHPTWLPDGSGIVFESNCIGGNWEIYRANLSYTVESNAQIRVTKLISPTEAVRLTNNNTDDRWPRISPDGSKIAFFASRDGNTEIYTMGGDGSQQRRITNSAGRDEAPTWSPDSRQIIFNSNRDGDHELYIMNGDGGNVVQLTNNGLDDGFAVWGQ